jgi:lipoprotein
MRNMNILKSFCLLSIFFFSLFGAVSCDDISAEPTATPPSVKIPAAGGEATAKVLRMDGGKLRTKWAYKSVEVEKGIFYRRDSTLRIDTLTDGRVKYSSTWYAFYVNMAKNEIHVVVSPNKSKNQRSVRFLGDDLYGAGLVSFEVDQEADSTAAN